MDTLKEFATKISAAGGTVQLDSAHEGFHLVSFGKLDYDVSFMGVRKIWGVGILEEDSYKIFEFSTLDLVFNFIVGE